MNKKVSIHFTLEKPVIDYLRSKFSFTDAEIKNNLEIFEKASKQIDILMIVSGLTQKALDATNPKGYIIGALRKLIE
ncbi:MAG: hypothetical protein ACEPOW_09315 [Bacteroidales bacterium]